jgi:hypothetical protein
MDYQAETLKNNLKSMPRDTWRTHQLAAPYSCTTTPLHSGTSSLVHRLIYQTKSVSRQSVCSASASQSGLRALARGSIGDQGTPLFEPSGEFGVTPQWCPSTKLPAQRAAVRLAGALRTLWCKVTH